MTEAPKRVTTHAGVTLPPLVYGTAWKKERTAELVEQALAAGFRGVDTACQPKHYDEAGVGRGLIAGLGLGIPRDALFVQTKFTPIDGQDPARVPYDRAAPLHEQVAQSVTRSLANLLVGRLDSLVLHSPLARFEETLEVWRALEQAHAEGRTRQLGISNCYQRAVFERLWDAATVKPAVLQNRFYRDTGYDVALREFCRERDVVYQSFWTLSANPHLLASGPVRAAAEAHGRTPAQVLYRALTQLGIVPLIGTTSREHMQQDLDIFSFALPPDHLAAIEALFR